MNPSAPVKPGTAARAATLPAVPAIGEDEPMPVSGADPASASGAPLAPVPAGTA